MAIECHEKECEFHEKTEPFCYEKECKYEKKPSEKRKIKKIWRSKR